MSLRDQLIANADQKPLRTFIARMSEECRAMIAEGILLFRSGEIPIETAAELSRSLQRIAEKQYPEDHAKWPEQGTFKRYVNRVTDQELQDLAKPQQSKSPKRQQKSAKRKTATS